MAVSGEAGGSQSRWSRQGSHYHFHIWWRVAITRRTTTLLLQIKTHASPDAETEALCSCHLTCLGGQNASVRSRIKMGKGDEGGLYSKQLCRKAECACTRMSILRGHVLIAGMSIICSASCSGRNEAMNVRCASETCICRLLHTFGFLPLHKPSSIQRHIDGGLM